MKKFIAVSALVFGVAMFAHAQSATPSTKKTSQITEAPRPAGDNAAGLKPSSTSTTPSTTRTESNVLQPSNPVPSSSTSATPSTRSSVTSPENRINIDGKNATPTAQPIVKPNTTVAPKN